ncbi:MAG: hypothetical protein WCY88_00875 [Spongiibacteraceae bacterium]
MNKVCSVLFTETKPGLEILAFEHPVAGNQAAVVAPARLGRYVYLIQGHGGDSDD